MWTIILNFALKFWKPLVGIIAILLLLWLKTVYDSRLVEKGRHEIQVKFDAYVKEQEQIALVVKQKATEEANKAREFERIATKKAQQLAELAKKEVQYETKTKIVYRNCKLPDSGLLLYNRAANNN